jgi:hypothetical protein
MILYDDPISGNGRLRPSLPEIPKGVDCEGILANQAPIRSLLVWLARAFGALPRATDTSTPGHQVSHFAGQIARSSAGR